MYKTLIRPILFRFDAEKAHHITFSLLGFLSSFGIGRKLLELFLRARSLDSPVDVAGIVFPNRVGLAAGFDKNGVLLHAWPHLGFGFVEVGTVTPLAQPGNDKPRLFRLIHEEAIINRMGFNNEGVEALAKRLKNRPKGLIIGGNIGKNKITPNEEAVSDYLKCLNELHPLVDYFVVNVSSPNTPNLRELQEKEPLKHLLQQIQTANLTFQHPKPVFLKIAPDLSESQLDDIIEIVLETKLAGVVATNTTTRRDVLNPSTDWSAIGAGGLSGKPIKEISNSVIRYLAKKAGKQFAIIAVGGISSAEDAIEKLKAGASLVQVYTGYVYEGPGLVKKLKSKIKQTSL